MSEKHSLEPFKVWGLMWIEGRIGQIIPFRAMLIQGFSRCIWMHHLILAPWDTQWVLLLFIWYLKPSSRRWFVEAVMKLVETNNVELNLLSDPSHGFSAAFLQWPLVHEPSFCCRTVHQKQQSEQKNDSKSHEQSHQIQEYQWFIWEEIAVLKPNHQLQLNSKWLHANNPHVPSGCLFCQLCQLHDTA